MTAEASSSFLSVLQITEDITSYCDQSVIIPTEDKKNSFQTNPFASENTCWRIGLCWLVSVHVCVSAWFTLKKCRTTAVGCHCGKHPLMLLLLDSSQLVPQRQADQNIGVCLQKRQDRWKGTWRGGQMYEFHSLCKNHPDRPRRYGIQ